MTISVITTHPDPSHQHRIMGVILINMIIIGAAASQIMCRLMM